MGDSDSHNSANVLNATGLYTYKWFKSQILCSVYFTTIKKIQKREVEVAWRQQVEKLDFSECILICRFDTRIILHSVK